MKFIDTHTHIYLDAFNEDRSQAVKRAVDAGVDTLLLPNIDSDSVEDMHQLVTQYPEHCKPMMGLHPTSVDENWERELQKVKERLDDRDYIAVGEIGIDLYWDKTYQSQQEEAFLQQCQWAVEKDLPISIHCRKSMEQVIVLLEKKAFPGLKGVFHCFTGSREQAERIIAMGFSLGIGGVLTFKNSRLRNELSGFSPSNMVLETDAPFLSPVPYRGKRNEPAYIPLIANHLADALDYSPAEVAEATTAEAKRVFNL